MPFPALLLPIGETRGAQKASALTGLKKKPQIMQSNRSLSHDKFLISTIISMTELTQCCFLLLFPSLNSLFPEY